MRETWLRTHHHPVNEKSFKIGLNLQKNVRIHPLSWEKTLYFEVLGHEGIYYHLTEYELNNRDTLIGKTVGDVAKATRVWDIVLTCLGKFFKGLSTAIAAPAQMVIDATGKLVDMVSLFVAVEAKSKFGIDIGYTCISSVCKEFDKCWDQEFYSGSCDTGRMKGDLVKGALKEAASLALPIIPMGEQAIACAKGSCEDCGGVAAVFVPSLDIARALERESPVKRKAGSEPPKSGEGQPSPGAEGHATSELATGGETKRGEGEGKAGAAGEKRKTGDHPEPPKEPPPTAEGTRIEDAVRSDAERAGSEVKIGGAKHAVGAYGRGEFGGFQLCSHCGLLAEKLAEIEEILPKDSDLASNVRFIKETALGYDHAYRKGQFERRAVAEQAARELAGELRKGLINDPFVERLLDMKVEDLRSNRATLKKQAASHAQARTTPAQPRLAGGDPEFEAMIDDLFEKLEAGELASPDPASPQQPLSWAEMNKNVQDARAAINYGNEPGKISAEVHVHQDARALRGVKGLAGKVHQSMHVSPTAFMKSVTGYIRNKATAMLGERAKHVEFDRPWKEWAQDQRRLGETDVTVGDFYDVMEKAILDSPLTDQEKGALHTLLIEELYQESNLTPTQNLPLPYAKTKPLGPGAELDALKDKYKKSGVEAVKADLHVSVEREHIKKTISDYERIIERFKTDPDHRDMVSLYRLQVQKLKKQLRQ
jgi:hypothetical protein